MAGILALADDLTGALEVGAKFAEEGIPAVVTTSLSARHGGTVEVIDVESRHLTARAAAASVSAVAWTAAAIIYKKTDSTLRGNIAAELGALADAHPDSTIAYVPAYPALGRTVKDGQLYVYGVLVHSTAFAADPLEPITDSSIVRLVEAIPRCTVHDGETDAEVARATATALADPRCRIIAGPASVAAEIARQFAGPRRPRQPWPRVRNCLIVNGSLHEVSMSQVAFAEERGCASAGAEEPWRILRPPISVGTSPLEIAHETGRLVRRYLDDSDVDAVMVFGGDTAFGILKALGCPPLEPIGEVITGAPVSRVVGRKLCFITKAGGFGDERFICSAKQLLHGND